MGKLARILFTAQRNINLKCSRGFRIAALCTIFFLPSFFIGLELAAQAHNYSILHFTNENGLPQNSIKGIEIDKKGYVWLATEVGLTRYDGRRFLFHNQLNSPARNGERIVRIALLPDSSMFVEGEGEKLYLVGGNETLIPYFPDQETKRKIDSSAVFRTFELYDSCKARVIKGNAPTWIMPGQPGVASASLNSLKYIHGQYFYFNKNLELISADPQFRNFKKIGITGQLAAELKSIDRDRPLISLITGGNKLYVRAGAWIYYLEMSNQSEMVKTTRVLEVGAIPSIPFFLEWAEQNLYIVGTSADGLYIFKKQSLTHLQFNNAELNVFYALVPFGKDGVFTREGLLFPGKSLPLKSAGIKNESLLQTRDGHYFACKWINKDASGIVEFNEQLEQIRFIPEYNLVVRCFRQFNDGKVWFSDEEHFLGKINDNKISYIPRPKELPADFIVSTFVQKNANEIWVAGKKGLAKVDTSGKLVRLIPELVNVNIRCLYQDKKGIIWVGSYGKGFFALYDDHVVSLPMDKNNYLAAAHSFLEDQNGFLWVTTNRGLFQMAINDLHQYLENNSVAPYYHYYEQSDGLLTNEFNGGCNPSGIVLNNGKFCFPSLESIVQFHPDSVMASLPGAPIFIDAIIEDTTQVDPVLSSFSLPKRINRLQFFVSSPYFGNAYNQQIQYQLNGLDSNWYPVNENGFINFNRLASGDYELVLRKKAGFGINNYIVERRQFTVKPTFSETWLFKALLVAAFFLLAYLFYRLRIRYLLQQKRFLEKEVLVRTREQKSLIESLENTIKELEESKEQLHQNNLFKERLSMIIMHDLQSPLRFLFDATRRAHEKSTLKRYSELNEISLELFKATGKIYSFVNDFGWWLSTTGSHFKTKSETIDVPDLLTELNQFFVEQLKANGNRIKLTLDGNRFISSDRQLLKIILRNVIDNANKHTKNGTIEIKTSITGGSGSIAINDSGFGIDHGLLAKLKLRLKETSIDYSEKESGFGYRFITDLSKLLDIGVDIKSEKGTGTAVTLSNLKIAG